MTDERLSSLLQEAREALEKIMGESTRKIVPDGQTILQVVASRYACGEMARTALARLSTLPASQAEGEDAT